MYNDNNIQYIKFYTCARRYTYNTAGFLMHKHNVIILNSFLKILTYLFTVTIRNV